MILIVSNENLHHRRHGREILLLNSSLAGISFKEKELQNGDKN
jgi:hypothetical protein